MIQADRVIGVTLRLLVVVGVVSEEMALTCRIQKLWGLGYQTSKTHQV